MVLLFFNKKILIITILFCLSACSSIKVQLIEGAGEIIPRNASYGWELASLENNAGVDSRAQLIDRQLRQEINKALVSKGLKAVDTAAKPQWLIGYRMLRSIQYDQGGIISPRDDMERMLHQGMDDPNTETAFYNHPVPLQLERAELIVTLMSASEKKTLWEVKASKLVEVDELSDKALQQLIIKIVAQAFKQFPVVR